MKREELLHVYDPDYAKAYNDRFLLSPFSKPWADFELKVLKELIRPGTQWLDLGCGTGFYLGQFPGVARAGLDLNPTMLQEAQQASPDALFFREADFRIDVPEWHQQWSLISCMWGAYIYVDTLQEVEQVVLNMVKWLKTGGTLFLPTIDTDDLRPQSPTTYEEFAFEYEGVISMNCVIWDWLETSTGKLHKNLISPHTGHFVKLLKPYFDQIDVVLYPFHPRAGSRKAIVASGRREKADVQKETKTTWHEAPNNPGNRLTVRDLAAHNGNPLSVYSHKQLFSELTRRLTSGRIFRSIGRKLMSK